MTASALRPVGPPPERLEALAVEDDLCVYDPATDVVHLLNGSAAAVWERCDGTRTEPELAADLAAAYAADPAVVAADVAVVLHRLRRDGLLP